MMYSISFCFLFLFYYSIINLVDALAIPPILPTNLLPLFRTPFKQVKKKTSPSSSSVTNSTFTFKNTKSASSSSNVLPLFNADAFLYLIEIGIGPTQKFTVAIDTGSADTWVPSNKCPKEKCDLDKYDLSTTNQNNNIEPFSVTYGSGTIKGEYRKETITIGNIVVHDQQFGAVSDVSGFTLLPEKDKNGNDQPSLDGLLGLGFPGLTGSDEGYDPVVISMYKQKLIQEPVFSIYLNERDAQDYAGEIIFGGIDQDKYTGSMGYIPLIQGKNKRGKTDYTHWAFRGGSISTQSNQKHSFKSSDVLIFDTGSTFTYFSKDIIDSLIPTNLKNNINYNKSQNLYFCNCDLLHDTENSLQLTLPQTNSKTPLTITIPVANLIVTDGTNDTNTQCVFGMVPLGESEVIDTTYGGRLFILGDTILRSLYLVFNFREHTIGVAAAKNVGGTVSVN
ncbi:aspartic peptidase domain-containing protein [Cunninghamella echinulata]|nr:aspartic peptidase domain-containing protein [Cunninghamella echinulata]